MTLAFGSAGICLRSPFSPLIISPIGVAAPVVEYTIMLTGKAELCGLAGR
jgi:hypothetical protein